MVDEFSYAPWSEAEVVMLNEHQAASPGYSVQCPSGHGVLVASTEGWACGECNFVQGWAHGFMLHPPLSLFDASISGAGVDGAK